MPFHAHPLDCLNSEGDEKVAYDLSRSKSETLGPNNTVDICSELPMSPTTREWLFFEYFGTHRRLWNGTFDSHSPRSALPADRGA